MRELGFRLFTLRLPVHVNKRYNCKIFPKSAQKNTLLVVHFAPLGPAQGQMSQILAGI